MTGVIVDVMETQSFGQKGFKKREFVVEEQSSEKYPQKLLLTLTQDRCTMIDSYGIGDTISVSGDIKGREWNGKHFITLEVARILGEKRAPVEEQSSDDIIDELLGRKPSRPLPAEEGPLPDEELESIGQGNPLGDTDDLPF